MCNGIKIVLLGCEKHSQKWPKNRHFSTFFDFLKNCPYDSNENFYSHSTPYESLLCAMASKSYGWDVRNIAKISPKMAKKTVIFRFFRFSHKLFIRFERKRVRRKDLSRLLYRIRGSGFFVNTYATTLILVGAALYEMKRDYYSGFPSSKLP